MYLAMNLLLMAALPLFSTAMEVMQGGNAVFALARWFVFWSCGVRLLMAGVTQVLKPDYTATTIFHITDPEAGQIVNELGFANLAMGLVAALSLLRPGWVVPAALTGTIFLGLAGLKHLRNTGRSERENVALASDLFVAVMLAACLVAMA